MNSWPPHDAAGRLAVEMSARRIEDAALTGDPTPLADWFDATLGGPRRSIVLTRVWGGASNSLFRVDRDGRRFALRRPPSIVNDHTSHDIERELVLARALSTTDVPHARLVGGTTDPRWIGGPFIVLGWIEGFTPRDPMPGPFDRNEDRRRALGDAVVDALAGIGGVDWRSVGLVDFGRPDGFLDRQVARWDAQYRRNQVRELAGFDALAAWLRDNLPAASAPGLMHGDYSLANVMVAPDDPPRIAAVIDWELATIGDPLLDLGHLLSSWGDATTGPTWAYYIDWTRGFRGRAAAAERYAARSGRDIADLGFYMALALFRLAILLEGSFARHVRGLSDNPRHAAFEQRVPALIRQAETIIERY